MKIILTSINSKYIHSSLGIWYLYEAAKTINHKHKINVFESTINNHIDDVAAYLLEEAADVIGFSAYIWNIDFILEVIKIIKQISPNTIIFLGGPEASYDAENLLKISNIDFIIKGEGEGAFIDLVQNDFKNFQKIIMPTKVNIEINPYKEEYMKALNGRIAYIETSRGCPFSCAFCLSGRDENVRFFDLTQAKENILKLANSGTQTVKFIDRTFNCNDKRALEIFEYIVSIYNNNSIPKNIVFHFEVEADLFSKETLLFLSTVPNGLFQFEAGLQSFNVETLKAVDRRSDITRLVNNLKSISNSNNIHLHIDLIAGLPFESYTSFVNGFNLAYEIKAHVIQLGFLKLLKGSSLEKNKEKYDYKYCDNAPYQILENNSITYFELLKLKKAEDAVDRLLNSGRFITTIDYILNNTNLQPYDVFYNFGKYIYINNVKSPSLELYAKLFYDFFINEYGLDRDKLRDNMAFDFITTDKSGKLPKFLHVFDQELKDINSYLKNYEIENFENSISKTKSGQIGFIINYSNNNVIVVDYTDKNTVTGVYNNTSLSKDIFIR